MALPATTTRDKLLVAAVEVFVRQGYESARVNDIARTAGLTTGAIYANFRGKDELLFEAMGARADEELDAILTETDGQQARGVLELLGDRLFEPRPQTPLLLDAIAAARRDESLARAMRERMVRRERQLEELIERAQSAGMVDHSVDAAAFGRFCHTLAFGALMMRTLGMEQPDPQGWHDLIARLLDAVAEDTP